MKRLAVINLALLALATMTVSVALAEPPAISDPEGRAPVGAMPGAYPTTVTAANIRVEQFLPAEIGGTGSDNMRVSFPSAGPIKWTSPRLNEGDFALNVGPFDPADPSYYPPTTFTNNYRPLDGGEPFANTTLGWRLNNQKGLALASVRHNGIDLGPNFTIGGSPVGKIHGIAYVNQVAAGWGYRMSDGVFANGGAGSLDLQMGVAGSDFSLGEATFDTAVAFFPYEQGWQGAWVNGGDDGAATFATASPGLEPTAVAWSAGLATVTLPGVNSATDGMLFVSPTHDANPSNIAAAFPTGGGWSVAVREDEEINPEFTLGSSGNGFQFMYVPYSAANLIGGHINGSTGAAINAAGETRFDLTRTAAGQYSLAVYEADGVTKKTGDDGMLIMSVAGALPSNPAIADRAFMSYQYDAGAGNFIIQTREQTEINSLNSENFFGDLLSLRDANFYFAWVDFENPLAPSAPISGDYTGDGRVDADDLADWKTSFGAGNGADGDGDGDTDGADFLIWQRNYGTGVPSQSATSPVPEPTTAAMIAIAGAFLAASRGRRRRT